MPFRELSLNDQGFVGIGLDITDRCNRRCRTCFATLDSHDMSSQVFKKIVDEAEAFGFPEFYILGGEPCIRKDILEILAYVSGKFKVVILVTNADYLADERLCRLISQAGVVIAAQRHSITDTSENRSMENYLSGGDHFDSSNAGWQNIEKYFSPSRICVQCCITRPVVDSGNIFEVFRWARRKGYEPVMEFTKEGGFFKRDCDMDVSPEIIESVLAEFQRIDRQEFGLPGADLLSPQAYDKTCHMQENSIHFRVDGEVIPCVGFPGLSYGNIMDLSLKEILDNPIRQHIRNPKSWIYGYCKDECPHFEQCTGGCRGSAFDMTGCYRASFYYCPHIPRSRLKLADMIPSSCTGCPLEGNPTCNPRRG